AGVAGDRSADAPVDAVAHILDEGGVDEPRAGRMRRRRDLDLADRKSGCADALKIKVAGEVVAAWPQRREGRIEPRLHFDERTDGRRLTFAHRNPHPIGRLVEAAALEPLDLDDDPIGALALLARFDPTGNGDVAGGMMEHRMRDPGALDGDR